MLAGCLPFRWRNGPFGAANAATEGLAQETSNPRFSMKATTSASPARVFRLVIT